MDDESVRETLEARRLAVLRRLGPVQEQVVSRIHPLGGLLWPASALGRMRIVKRPTSRLLVTDGLSDPYDRELHPSPPPAPLDFELAIDVADVDPLVDSDDALAGGWFCPLLYSLADWIVAEWLDLRGLLGKFRVVTLGVPPTTPEAEKLVSSNGMVGMLIGLPLIGSDIDAHLYPHGIYSGLGLAPEIDQAAIGYLPVKPLTPDEYDWAVAHGDEGGVALAERFVARGDGRLAWTGRPSVLLKPEL